MYTMALSSLFLLTGFLLYRTEYRKKPEARSSANLLIAMFATMLGIAIMAVALLYWND